MAARLDPPSRIVIDLVTPSVDGGRFPIKRIVGDVVGVEAVIFADGHDALTCRLVFRHESDEDEQEAAMVAHGNDRWRGEFPVEQLGRYRYTVEAWVDHFVTWQRDMAARIAASQDERVDALVGADLIAAAASRATGRDAAHLAKWAKDLREEPDPVLRNALATDADLGVLARRYPDRRLARRFDRELEVIVDRARAGFSSWYEVFPRSCAAEPGRHGTLRDCAAWVPGVAAMGFDVLYLPPIHPIGRQFRKGRNNRPDAEDGDVGSPWAIGAAEGGHTAIHPALGTIEDFRALIDATRAHGMDLALDLAYQCAPDHPYVAAHPEWFKARPDGTIQYAENPPKKYQDIYPFDFESEDWRALWDELKHIVEFWIGEGVRIFRVDNPHTKSFAFWEWMIADLKARHPDLIFLAEAFTRPSPMYALAKRGFTQSYTYFTWRNTKQELTEYFRDLATSGVREFFRPNLWPNTPDILHESLQTGGRQNFMIRGVLAATLGANYGVYGPAFELCEHEPREPGSEEYKDSEKYQVRHRSLDAPGNLRPLLTTLNRIRHENVALQSDHSLRFHDTDNPMLICYSKATADFANVILTVVNLDPVFRQSGFVSLDLASLGIDTASSAAFQVHDLLSDSRYLWQGPRNYIELAPGGAPAHVFSVTSRAVNVPVIPSRETGR
jgi:starch synthase (maltosyl-transferring)